MTGEFGSLILVNGVGDVCAGTLDLNLSADAALGSVPAGALRYYAAGTSWRRAR